MHHSLTDLKIGIIGLGYVGLPLAVEFGKKYKTLGFDINQGRVTELQNGHDATLEVSDEELNQSPNLSYSHAVTDLEGCNIYIVTVPTPIDEHKQPDLTPLIKASEMLGKVVKKGDIIIYESTVYPGATEEACLPVVEQVSGLKFNQDFFAGYSPERINPGDKSRRVRDILKITSGSNMEVSELIDNLYSSVIVAGTHKAPSIRVAEAAKVIENVQRDVNIALINELHQIFTKLEINTEDVIEAAATKWNFMKLSPGLVGGHCIGVDPYYLLHKSQTIGVIPDMIRNAREINNGMAHYFSSEIIKASIKKKVDLTSSKVLILGVAFKPNCPDIRNSKVFDLIDELRKYGLEVSAYDPLASKSEVLSNYGEDLLENYDSTYNIVVKAVRHSIFDDFSMNNADLVYTI